MTEIAALSLFRCAFRNLLRSPGFTLLSVLTLAVGSGAATAVFSVVDGVLLRPLPYPQPDRLVTLMASYLPAERAARIDPLRALQQFE